MAQKTLINDLLGAEFSDCRTWRYALWRIWAGQGNVLTVIGLNPSTADETVDDPTIRRCLRFARDWGHSGLYMLNLLAYRATLPDVMRRAADPVGPANDDALIRYAAGSSRILAAWGTHGDYGGRGAQVLELLGLRVECLGKTKEGYPRHPLYVPAATRPIPYYTPKRGTSTHRAND